MSPLYSVLFLVVCVISLAQCDIPGDKIASMPNYNQTTNFNQYGGYITVDESHGRALYYQFLESQNDPKSDPVVLWLNGGPGCSSLDGFFYEHGFYHFERCPKAQGPCDDENLRENQYAWNRAANIIYLESPAGVGFSYSNTTSDYETNDNKTAVDNAQFLVNFFKSYSEFADNDFYIAGESYAGIYVPTLAWYVHQQNVAGNMNINLKGVLVGNGVTNDAFDGNSFITFAHNHALYSPALYEKIVNKDCLNKNTIECEKLILDVYLSTGNINTYDIYTPCYEGEDLEDEKYLYSPLRRESFDATPRSALTTPPCINSKAATIYLNDDSVRTAIHAGSKALVGEWSICSNKVRYRSLYDSVEDAYKVLTQNYRVLIYSGDVDGAVPYVGTMGWVNDFETKMGNNPTKTWQVWNVEDQVAGYATVYPDNLIFTTIKGSGHMVPQYKPHPAYVMFSEFLKGTFPN